MNRSASVTEVRAVHRATGPCRIALTPLVNHWWNATLFVTARGLAAPAMPYDGRTFDVVFDFVDHRLVIETSDGRVEDFALEPMAVADFYSEFMQRLRRLGIDVQSGPCRVKSRTRSRSTGTAPMRNTIQSTRGNSGWLWCRPIA